MSEPIALCFSGGKDSIMTLRLFQVKRLGFPQKVNHLG